MRIQRGRTGAVVERLRTRYDFRRVYENGRSYASRHLVIFLLPNDMGKIRVGYSVGKRLGNAVTRNHIRRLLKESFRSVATKVSSHSIDIVWIARGPSVDGSVTQFTEDMEKLLGKAGLLR